MNKPLKLFLTLFLNFTLFFYLTSSPYLYRFFVQRLGSIIYCVVVTGNCLLYEKCFYVPDGYDCNADKPNIEAVVENIYNCANAVFDHGSINLKVTSNKDYAFDFSSPYTYHWNSSNGTYFDDFSSSKLGEITQPGIYSVVITQKRTGCQYQQSFEVKAEKSDEEKVGRNDDAPCKIQYYCGKSLKTTVDIGAKAIDFNKDCLKSIVCNDNYRTTISTPKAFNVEVSKAEANVCYTYITCEGQKLIESASKGVIEEPRSRRVSDSV